MKQLLFLEMKLCPTEVVLKMYTNECMREMTVAVQYEEQPVKQLGILVVAGDSPCLLGLNWLYQIRLG